MVYFIPLYIFSMIAVAIIGLIANFFVLFTVLVTPSLHSVTNVLVSNLALADISVGLVACPLYIAFALDLPREFTGCLIINSTIISCTNVSFIMLLMIAVERLLATKAPFYHYSEVTLRNAYLCNFVAWIAGAIEGFFPLVWNVRQEVDRCYFGAVVSYEYMVYYRFIAIIIVPSIIMICIYAYIIIIIRRYEREWETLLKAMYAVDKSDRTDVVIPRSRHLRKELRSAKFFAILVLVFAFLWLPPNIFITVYMFCPDDCSYTKEAILVNMWLSHLNTCLNPFIYAESSLQLSTALKRNLGFEVKDEEKSHMPYIRKSTAPAVAAAAATAADESPTNDM